MSSFLSKMYNIEWCIVKYSMEKFNKQQKKNLDLSPRKLIKDIYFRFMLICFLNGRSVCDGRSGSIIVSSQWYNLRLLSFRTAGLPYPCTKTLVRLYPYFYIPWELNFPSFKTIQTIFLIQSHNKNKHRHKLC